MKTPEVLYRYYETHSYYNNMRSLSESMVTYPLVNFRYFIEPSVKYPISMGFNLSTVFMQTLIDLGYKDAVNATKSKANAREILSGWKFNGDIIYP